MTRWRPSPTVVPGLPDWGLETRGWPEVEASPAELVAAAARSRGRLVAQVCNP